MADAASTRDRYESAHAEWAPLEVSLPEFRAFVDRAGTSADDLAVHAGELFLACACAAGKVGALESFVRAYGVEIEAGARRLSGLVSSPDDAKQIVLQRLFAGDRPKIAEYGGTGSLKAWVRVVTLRTLLNLRRAPEEPFGDDEAIERLATSDNPELTLIKHTYAKEFREVLASSAQCLDVKERALLRLAFIDGLTVDAIGEIYGVHRSTAARWVRDAHEGLTKTVRAQLRARLRMTTSELDSVAQLVESALDTSLSKYLNSASRHEP